MKGTPLDYHAQSNVPDYRTSGLTLALMLAALYGLTLLKGTHHVTLLVAALAVAAFSWFRAQPLRLIIDLCIMGGNVMRRFTNPIVFACIYIAAVVPVALVLRMLGKDLLQPRFDATLPSYWLKRAACDWKDSFNHPF